MAEHRAIFRAGAAKDGLSEEKADEIFDLMEKFAGYGFNKSHAAAYALLSYHTAYLKAHHPAAFMAANMSLAMDDTDKVKILVEDAIDICGLTILPPDINKSDSASCRTARRLPSRQEGHADPLRPGRRQGRRPERHRSHHRRAQAGGPFTSLFDFCKRVDKKQINRRTIESLIRAGAFDCFGVDRAVLLASVGFAMEYADQQAKSANQVSLFGGDDSDLERRRNTSRPRRSPTARSWPRKRSRWASTCPATCSIRLRRKRGALRAPSWPTWSRRASRACCAA
jgi:DNA polymerase-3 subunit alpha